jgi:hypothetical protein
MACRIGNKESLSSFIKSEGPNARKLTLGNPYVVATGKVGLPRTAIASSPFDIDETSYTMTR